MLAEELDEELRKLMIDSGRQEDGEVTVCPEHGEEYKRYEKNGSAWWSHQIPGGGWCKRGF